MEGNASPTEPSWCRSCRAQVPTVLVSFSQNVGALFRRYETHLDAYLCRRCIHRSFWKFTLTTLAVGWLGLISLFVAPVYVLQNVYQYLRALSVLRRYEILPPQYVP